MQLTDKDKKKRADGHIWPKGTFLQLKRGNKESVLTILQRKQQSHDHNEWKGVSHPFDLTMEVMNTTVPIEIKLCSKEIVENSASNNEGWLRFTDGTLAGSYALHVAICEYVAPDELYKEVMGEKAGGDMTIPKISLRSATKRAKEYLVSQMVSIPDSDDEDKDANSQGKNHGENESLTFSLLCPMSMSVMRTPVRGRNCKHMQCFDLRNFLDANKNVTGGRWRCGVCCDFVNVRDLVHCGLFQAMVDELGEQVSISRDRVSVHSDGTWRLMDENRLRYAKGKRGGAPEEVNIDSDPKKPSEPEVIELS